MKNRIAVPMTLCCMWAISTAGPASAATRYYSRDGHGTKDGLSYANRGAYSSVTPLKALPGDTIYFCGKFVPPSTNVAPVTVASSGMAQAPITIRMDYPGDPGTFYGFIPLYASHSPPYTWKGPDASGYYCYPRKALYVVAANLGEANEEILPLTEKMSASDGIGYYVDSNSTYVKMRGGSNPTGHIYQGGNGYRFILTGRSYITFRNCTSVGGMLGKVTGASHMTFDGCVVRYSKAPPYNLFAGNDDWTWIDCTIDHVGNGIYSNMQGHAAGTPDPGALRGHVLRGHISYTGFQAGLAFKNNDSHGIGLQNSTGWIVDGVEIDHTSSAIEIFKHANQPCNSNEIRNCAIHDTIAVGAKTSGSGVVLNHADSTCIHNNVFWNIAGRGISSTSDDPATRVENNSIYNVGYAPGYGMGVGIRIKHGTVRNNIIQGCQYFVELYDITVTGATIDHNWLSGHGSSGDFYAHGGETLAQWQARGHDTHSRTGPPGWSKSAPAVKTDFRLLSSSQAIASGASVLYADPDGKLIGKTMGAYAAPALSTGPGFAVQPRALH